MYKVIENKAYSAQSLKPIADSIEKLMKMDGIGFTQIPARTHLFDQSTQLAAELGKKYEQFVVIGIGGSSMGSRALAELTSTQNLHFLDNVDAAEFSRLWNEVKKRSLAKTGFLVVSKSGSTIEILWNYSLIEQLMQEAGLSLISQSYFVSELNDNPLAALAKKHQRPLLEVPFDVGGRFSVLTPVGLVVAALCGFNLNDLRAGAAAAVADKGAVAEACALYLDSFKRGEDITLFWFYNSNYRWFGAWLQQLWAESLGKKLDLGGRPAPGFSTPMSAIGACDQHSILQQVAHGTKKNKFVCFFNFKSAEQSEYKIKHVAFGNIDFAVGKNYGELISNQVMATEEALKQNGVSTYSFKVNDENKSYSVGYLFMYFQMIVATLGVHENINPFDQPGVALGKELTLKKFQS